MDYWSMHMKRLSRSAAPVALLLAAVLLSGCYSTGIDQYFSPPQPSEEYLQLQELIDRLHNAGIGVIMDFVPAHFALDYYALRKYDIVSTMHIYPGGGHGWGFNHPPYRKGDGLGSYRDVFKTDLAKFLKDQIVK